MLRLVFAILLGFSLFTYSASAHAQEPEPVGRLTLTETSPGEYQLEFQAVSDRAPYVVRYYTSGIGTDQGLFGHLPDQAAPFFVIDVPLPLDGMTQEGCYFVRFFVTPEAEGQNFDSGARIETKGCVDSAGVTTFPAHDHVIAPPPPPPSDVRVTPQNDLWKIEWKDNSVDELSFAPGIVFLDRPWADGGSQISTMMLPEVPANQPVAYALGTGGFFFPDQPAEPTCGYAMVLVFAVGPDSPSVWPGNTTVPACFGGGTLSFPATGTGPVDASDRFRSAFLLLAAGVGMVLAGIVLRRLSLATTRR